MRQPPGASDDSWPEEEEETGPLVRLYAMTRGRTRHPRATFDLIAIVRTAGTTPDERMRLGPEHQAIVQLCRQPQSVAEISAEIALPLGVIRVLLGDLLDRRLIVLSKPTPATELPSANVLREVIEGIRAL